MIVLWLSYEEFPNKEKNLPKSLLRLKKYGLSIKWCENLRSYKKLIPSLLEFPDDIIVTIDDDVWYPPEWLERLYNSYIKAPQYIHAHRCLKVTSNNGIINRYVDWDLNIYAPQEPSYIWHFTGTGGVLYPPHCLHHDVTDKIKFMSMAPTVDDIWFWAMAVLNHTKIKVIENNIFIFEGVFIVNNKSLWSDNVYDKNDIALERILREYPELKKLILESINNIMKL